MRADVASGMSNEAFNARFWSGLEAEEKVYGILSSGLPAWTVAPFSVGNLPQKMLRSMFKTPLYENYLSNFPDLLMTKGKSVLNRTGACASVEVKETKGGTPNWLISKRSLEGMKGFQDEFDVRVFVVYLTRLTLDVQGIISLDDILAVDKREGKDSGEGSKNPYWEFTKPDKRWAHNICEPFYDL